MTTVISKPKDLASQFAQSLVLGPLEFMAEKGPFGTQALRAAFDGAFQSVGPYPVSDELGLSSFVAGLLQFAQEAILEKIDKLKKDGTSTPLVVVALACAQGLHSHNGKLIHASSKSCWTVRPGSGREPYLTSRSAVGQRWMSGYFSHLPSAVRPARLFLSNFTYSGRITSVAELLSENNEVVVKALCSGGVLQSDVDALVAIFQKTFSNPTPELELCLPQLLWPQEGGRYVALTGLPAQSVYNAISDMRTRVTEGHRLPMSAYEVGSGNPVNISVAACGSMGHIRMLLSLPPKISHTGLSRLLRLAVGSRLVPRFPARSLVAFGADIQALPNMAKRNFFKAHANLHARHALARVLALREAWIEDKGLVFPDSLSKTLHTVITSRKSVSEADLEELTKLVLEAGVAQVLICRSGEDVLSYAKLLHSAIANIV